MNNGNKQNKSLNKKGGKRKGEEVSRTKHTTHYLKPNGGISKEGTFFYCGRTRH